MQSVKKASCCHIVNSVVRILLRGGSFSGLTDPVSVLCEHRLGLLEELSSEELVEPLYVLSLEENVLDELGDAWLRVGPEPGSVWHGIASSGFASLLSASLDEFDESGARKSASSSA